MIKTDYAPKTQSKRLTDTIADYLILISLAISIGAMLALNF